MKLTHIHKVRLTEQQAASLKVLKSYNVNVGNFIREKLHRDWKSIKERKSTNHCPL
jgi:hypothetical protein